YIIEHYHGRGNVFPNNRDLLETGTAEEQRAAVLKALQYGNMKSREAQLSKQNIPLASFEWVKTTGLPTWLQSRSSPCQPFWISGKPGSGKSSLMLYIIKSKSTRDWLDLSGSKWKLMHFFFDFRAGDGAANTTLGLLKTFTRTLVEGPECNSSLLRQLLAEEETTQWTEIEYLDAISKHIQEAGMKICAFIDGLDEFSGDPSRLCDLLVDIRDRTGIRMCLASRPHQAFVVALGQCPTLVMQDHNAKSIEVYLQHEIDRTSNTNPDVSRIFTPKLKQAIVRKSEGVILWARLVVDEMMAQSYTTHDSQEIWNFLEHMPPELEGMYTRTLDKLDKLHIRFRYEAAVVLLLLVCESEPRFEEQIFAEWDYLRIKYLGKNVELNQSDDDHDYFRDHEERLYIILGGLVEQVLVDDDDHDSLWSDYSCQEIRLLHETFSSFLRKSDWIQRNLPPSIQITSVVAYHAQLRLTLTSQALTEAWITSDDAVTRVNIFRKSNSDSFRHWPRYGGRIERRAHWLAQIEKTRATSSTTSRWLKLAADYVMRHYDYTCEHANEKHSDNLAAVYAKFDHEAWVWLQLDEAISTNQREGGEAQRKLIETILVRIHPGLRSSALAMTIQEYRLATRLLCMNNKLVITQSISDLLLDAYILSFAMDWGLPAISHEMCLRDFLSTKGICVSDKHVCLYMMIMASGQLAPAVSMWPFRYTRSSSPDQHQGLCAIRGPDPVSSHWSDPKAFGNFTPYCIEYDLQTVLEFWCDTPDYNDKISRMLLSMFRQWFHSGTQTEDMERSQTYCIVYGRKAVLLRQAKLWVLTHVPWVIFCRSIIRTALQLLDQAEAQIRQDYASVPFLQRDTNISDSFDFFQVTRDPDKVISEHILMIELEYTRQVLEHYWEQGKWEDIPRAPVFIKRLCAEKSSASVGSKSAHDIAQEFLNKSRLSPQRFRWIPTKEQLRSY
ncbi:hypothetical protein LTR66_015255, partial [Elasticomyces elasticus]